MKILMGLGRGVAGLKVKVEFSGDITLQ